MRIYNKRNFAAGILSLALAVACGVVLAVTGFQTKWLIALVLLLAAGGFYADLYNSQFEKAS